MPFYVIGVDHTTCPISIREAIALEASVAAEWVVELAESVTIDEVAVLSTCARTEVYFWSECRGDEALDVITALLVGRQPSAGRYIHIRSDENAVKHVFRVTAGLESQVVGEDEIAGQVRAAANQARALHSLGPNLDSLFRAATACSRRLRTESRLGSVNTSVATAAAEMFRASAKIKQSKILIIGSGKVARMVASEFRPAKRLVISARNPSAIELFAATVDAAVVPLPEAVGSLGEYDAVFCATKSRRPLIEAKHLKQAAPLVVFDLSIPRNVSGPKKHIPGITVYDVDAVKPPEASSSDSALIGSILEGEIREFLANQNARAVGPIIASLRDHVERVRLTELQRIRSQMASMDAAQREAVETVTGRMIDQMFHHLVIRLRLAATTDPDLIKAARFFFSHGQESVFPVPSVRSTPDRAKIPQP